MLLSSKPVDGSIAPSLSVLLHTVLLAELLGGGVGCCLLSVLAVRAVMLLTELNADSVLLCVCVSAACHSPVQTQRCIPICMCICMCACLTGKVKGLRA